MKGRPRVRYAGLNRSILALVSGYILWFHPICKQILQKQIMLRITCQISFLSVIVGAKLLRIVLLSVVDHGPVNVFFKKKQPSSASFFAYFRPFKHTIQFLQQIYVNIFMSIQYTVLGFEPTTFGT